MADQRHRLARLDGERDAVQHLGAALAVGEPDVLELDPACDLWQLLRIRPVGQPGIGIQHVEDLVQRRRSRQERLVELGQLLDRLEEVREQPDEHEQVAGRDLAVDHQHAAVPKHHRHRRGRQQVDDREVDGADVDRLHVGLAVGAVHLVESPLVRPLAAERLDDADAGDVLLQRGGDLGQPLSGAAVGARRVAAEQRGGDRHPREHGQRRQRQLPVQVEQHQRGADQRDGVLKQGGGAVCDQRLQRLDVVGQARDDDAGAGALEEAQVEPLDVLEQVDAEISEDPLADPAGQVALGCGRRPADPGDDHEHDHPHLKRALVAGDDALVDRLLGDQRPADGRGRAEQEGDHRQDRPARVGTRVADQAGHPADRRPPAEAAAGVAQPADVAAEAGGPHPASFSIGAPSGSSCTNVRSTSPCS